MDSYLLAWYDLVSKVMLFNLTNGNDVFVWNLQNSGIFSVRSMYTSITQCGVVPSNCKPSLVQELEGDCILLHRYKLASMMIA
jgi:hypothetical protein